MPINPPPPEFDRVGVGQESVVELVVLWVVFVAVCVGFCYGVYLWAGDIGLNR